MALTQPVDLGVGIPGDGNADFGPPDHVMRHSLRRNAVRFSASPRCPRGGCGGDHSAKAHVQPRWQRLRFGSRHREHAATPARVPPGRTATEPMWDDHAAKLVFALAPESTLFAIRQGGCSRGPHGASGGRPMDWWCRKDLANRLPTMLRCKTFLVTQYWTAHSLPAN